MIVAQQPREMLPHHRAATSAGRDDVLVLLEVLDKLPRQVARLVVKPVVIERLPATGLRARELDVAAEVLQDLRYDHANPWVELISQARNEQRDVDRHVLNDVLKGIRALLACTVLQYSSGRRNSRTAAL